MRRVTTCLFMMVVLAGVTLGGCSAAPRDQAMRDQLHEDVQVTISRFIRRDSTMERHFDESYGYVVYPNVGKGGLHRRRVRSGRGV